MIEGKREYPFMIYSPISRPENNKFSQRMHPTANAFWEVASFTFMIAMLLSPMFLWVSNTARYS